MSTVASLNEYNLTHQTHAYIVANRWGFLNLSTEANQEFTVCNNGQFRLNMQISVNFRVVRN